MKRGVLALWRMFVFAVIVPAFTFSLTACEPENGDSVTPEISVPDGYVNNFVNALSFSRLGGEVKVAFQINMDWTMAVDASASWCSVEPASGDAGLYEVMVRVSANDNNEPRFAKIHLLCGTSKVAEIALTQEEGLKHETIDLGLSVKWASCNVGATSPEEYGDYFAWGETTVKSDSSSSNSATDGLSISELKSRGIIGSDGNLTAEYDAATANWGGDWRMPTLDEFRELINNCAWSWTTHNGVKGYKVKSPTNGNSIFLPTRNAVPVGNYWSATPYGNSYSAYYLGFDSDDYYWFFNFSRCNGFVVRPVSE